jgi:hypothetical protein
MFDFETWYRRPTNEHQEVIHEHYLASRAGVKGLT